ncbi:immunity 49 family protein [Myxococcus sp. AB036A]|uniref:immunity 49 family protein n=1 Tax=Myxococcus sp. AB036A TaxID=2562793 RepID=UPI001891EADD|nr:immunity 49 family protein [Myxococcus sp. AB036A]
MDLETIRSNAHSALTDALKSIAVQGVAERSGKAYEVAALMYHRLALCELLAELRSDRFQVLLCKSALVRLVAMRLMAAGRTFHPLTTCASKNFSFVDAITAGQLDLAVALARLMPDRHEPQWEYEDDFLLHRFMHKRLLHLHAHEEHDLHPLLARWEQVVGGEHAPYLEACRMLLKQDADGFHDALIAVIEERGRQFKEKGAYPEEARRTDGALFMNGFALLRLAELGGLPTQREYPNIPRFARLPVSKLALPPDAWKTPDDALPS